MPIDSDVTKYAGSLFDHRLSEEIRPAYVNRLRELKTKYPSSAQLPFSGVDAQRLIEVETQFARDAGKPQHRFGLRTGEMGAEPYITHLGIEGSAI